MDQDKLDARVIATAEEHCRDAAACVRSFEQPDITAELAQVHAVASIAHSLVAIATLMTAICSLASYPDAQDDDR